MFRPRVLGTSLVVRQKRQRAYDLAERRKGFPIHLLLFLAGQRTELRRPGGVVAGSLMLNESYEILQKLAISRRRPCRHQDDLVNDEDPDIRLARVVPSPQLIYRTPQKTGADMTVVEETIPNALKPEVEAALAWFNQSEGVAFEVTGILDPEAALEASGSRDLHLILCGGDRCERRSFRVTGSHSGYDVAAVGDDLAVSTEGQAAARLDPPSGARRGWLDRALTQHAFVVLVFYRGFW